LSNIIGGNLKSAFVDVGLSCVLSTPSITNGIDFRVEALNIIDTQRFIFRVDNHAIIVDAGIRKEGTGVEAEPEEDGEEARAEAQEPAGEESEFPNLDLILKIPLEVTVELGRTKARISRLLKMGGGSVVSLDQLEGEPVDLLVNDTLVAKGEVQVENEKYGIRIVEVVSQRERINSLK
jgi:flagellar motor switch protein FliN